MHRALCGAVFACLLIRVSHAQAPSQRAPDEVAIRKTWQDYVAVWNRHDTKALATFFTEDVDRRGANGRVSNGRAAVLQAIEDSFGVNKDTTVSSGQVDVRFLSRDVAILDARDDVRSIQSAGVSTQRTNHTSIFVRQNGRWLTAAIRVWTLSTPAPTSSPDR